MAPISSSPKKNRPFWVWIISGFYLFSGVMNLSMLLMIHTENPGLTPEALADLQKTAMTWTLGGLLPLANLAGAGFLFMLRKPAFYIFSGMLAAGLLNGLIQFIRLDLSLEPLTRQGLTQALLGYAVTLCVCIYTYYLKKQGTLT